MKLSMYKTVFSLITSAIALIASFLLPGCDSTTCSSSPLKGINEYQVTLFISPYGDHNAEKIKKVVIEKLASLGEVVEAKVPISEETPMLFISIEPRASETPSTVQVLGRVKVLKNGYGLTSVIWSHPFRAGKVSIPIERDGKVSFVQKKSPSISQGDPLDPLLNAFVEEYRAANPKQTSITFLISQ